MEIVIGRIDWVTILALSWNYLIRKTRFYFPNGWCSMFLKNMVHAHNHNHNHNHVRDCQKSCSLISKAMKRIRYSIMSIVHVVTIVVMLKGKNTLELLIQCSNSEHFVSFFLQSYIALGQSLDATYSSFVLASAFAIWRTIRSAHVAVSGTWIYILLTKLAWETIIELWTSEI